MTNATGIGPGNRLTGRQLAGRSEILAPRAAAATSQPLATQAALDVMRRGGNAVDGALAANLCLALVEPMSCGLGGDLYALVWSEEDRRLSGLNGSGRAPSGAGLDVVAERCGGRLPEVGPLTVTVPGAVDGWWRLHRRFGRLPWGDLFETTIAYARDGFPITDLTAFHWRAFAGPRLEQPGFRDAFTVDGRIPVAGERRRDPDLARVLERVAAGGRDAFYGGETAARIARAVREAGGFLAPEDLEAHESTWVEPVSAPYRGLDVWQLPPPTQGVAVLQMLRLLEGFDLESMGFGSADHLHHVVEAKKCAFEDRARFYADPDFADVPLDALISEDYAAERRRQIRADRAAADPRPGSLRLDRGDTVCVVVADEDRNMVSLMQSLFLPFGSGVVPAGLGFALQNRGALFALDPDHANAYAPRKRPFHTLIPAFVTRDGEPHLCFGVMGGAAQPQVETQVLLNLVDFHMGLQEAGDAPRVLHEGSSQPTGEAVRGAGTVLLESGFPPETERELMVRGHRLGRALGIFGGYQAIRYDPEQNVYTAASECRQDGQAGGF